MKKGIQPGDRTPGVMRTTCTTCGAERTLAETAPCACGGRGRATTWVRDARGRAERPQRQEVA